MASPPQPGVGSNVPSTGQARTALSFTLKHETGSLAEATAAMREHQVNMTRIVSRLSEAGHAKFTCDLEGRPDEEHIQKAIEALKGIGAFDVTVLGEGKAGVDGVWYPRRIEDLDLFAHKTLAYGAELDDDHPGFTDEEYRKRRATIVQNATVYRHGEPIPHVEYLPEENETWSVVWDKVMELVPTHACQQYRDILPLLISEAGYSRDSIPQLQEVSSYLKKCTGFTLRPVMGLLSPRDFLNGLAHRVFHSTQYIRHHSKPLYTPEPDVCHELLGHVPLFADPDFADFSQEIGLASLGASDEDIDKLATCYWFTVEFGLCREGDGEKAYGAGLLSSFGELEYCLSDKPTKLPFDPFKACTQKYPITSYQPVYFVAESFTRAKEQMRAFGRTLDRNFEVKYNPYTQSVEELRTREDAARLATRLQSELMVLNSLITKLP